MRHKSSTLGTHERIFMALCSDELHHNLSIYSTVPEVAESKENLHEDKRLHRARLSLDKYLLEQEMFQSSFAEKHDAYIFYFYIQCT
jgi:hypothetical protein